MNTDYPSIVKQVQSAMLEHAAAREYLALVVNKGDAARLLAVRRVEQTNAQMLRLADVLRDFDGPKQ